MSSIIQEPDKRLHQISTSVGSLEEAKLIAGVLQEVTNTVDSIWRPWLGMAAPQVGFNKRVILLKNGLYQYQVMVNPEIIIQKWYLPVIVRCFSVRGIYLTKYHYWFKIKFKDLEGKYHTEIIRGGKAIALQQELDHINGVLISDIGIRVI